MDAHAGCSVDSCDALVTAYTSACLCNKHYTRVRRYGSTDLQRKPRHQICRVEGCDTPTKAKDLCQKHYIRASKYGAVDVVKKGNWSGEDASYVAVHQRLRRYRGAASTYECIECGHPAKQWAFTHNAEVIKSGIYGPYSTNLEDYQPMCVSCHKTMDMNRERA